MYAAIPNPVMDPDSSAAIARAFLPSRWHYHYVRTKVRVHRYVDKTLGVFHGPRKLASYDADGKSTNPSKEVLRAAA